MALADQAFAQSVEDLRNMSIDQLATVDVTSATKIQQPLTDAPAAIYVITHDAIVRSGAATVPEMLRLAPNLQVKQTAASQYVITARGFSGNSDAQNFQNKLLVLIDGRSVYSPLFSGVYWDMQDVVAEDVDRIEVISGPGATLWGANAVNGVINIITRKAGETQGALVDAGGGNLARTAVVRYGGMAGDSLAWRVYAKAYNGADTITAAGARATDNWSRPQGGFRLDWSPSASDAATLQGDISKGTEAQGAAGDETFNARNVLGRWTRTGADGSSLQVQAYYDYAERGTARTSGRFALNTWDIDLQQSLMLGMRNHLVWGGGARTTRYTIDSSGGLSFSPPSRTLSLSNIFVQDSLTITPQTTLILGLKAENDPYSGITLLPSVRATYKPSDTTLLWAAASRAIRSPTPFDRDVVETLGNVVFLNGVSSFEPEKLTAYELGARVLTTSRATFSISTFYNAYDGLRSIEATPVTFTPLHWGNGMYGDTRGAEVWGDYQARPWWRLSASWTYLSEDLRFRPSSSGLLGVSQAGDDPKQQASLRSSMDLGDKVTFDADLRYVSALPDPAVPSYTELNARLGWNLTDKVQLSVSGFNLLQASHVESPKGNPVPRSVFAELKVRY